MSTYTYFTTTFSPSMLGGDVIATVREVAESDFSQAVASADFVPAVGHENTAVLLSRKLGLAAPPFARVNITLQAGDVVLAAIPQFRPPEAREFSDEEVANARFRFFVIEVRSA